jgi:undecaprenyl-diphosphatase
MIERLLDCERELFYAVNGFHTRWLDSLMLAFSSIWIWFPLVAVPLYFFWKRRNRWIQMTVCTVLTVLFNFLITDLLFKLSFKRFRPTSHPDFMEHVHTVNDYFANGVYGFISGHTTNAFAFAMLSALAVKNRWYSILIFVWAALMGYSRIYLAAHFITDVVPGMIVGVLTGWGLYFLYRRMGRCSGVTALA